MILDNKKKINKSGWRMAALLWDKYSSPFRPSLEEKEEYNNLIDKYGSGNNLLLGSTPELRILFSLKKSKVTLVDSSREMMKHMLQLNKNINRKNEIWVNVNWLELNNYFKKRSFNLIIGDLVLRNLKLDEQKKFLKIASHLLSKKGTFIIRLHFIDESLLNKNSESIIKSVFNKKIKQNQDIEDLITSRLFDKCTNFENHKVDEGRFIEDIKQYSKKSTLEKKEKIILKNILKKWTAPKDWPEKTWIQTTEKEIQKIISNDFVIKDKITSTDHIDFKYYPIYVLKKH